MSNLRKFFLPGVLLFGVSMMQALNVGKLRTEYLENPIGIDSETPHFSWQLKSDRRSTVQKSYQVTLATDPAMASVIYDSGVIESGQSANVELENLYLEPTTRYYWTVTVTDNYGETAVSEPGNYFETGLKEAGWSGAQWITAGIGENEDSSDPENKTVRYDIDVDITLINHAASVVFSRTKSNCYFMWAINTNDYGYPLVRRHVYANSSNPDFSDTRIEGMTNEDFIGQERHMRLEIDGSDVRTYIDDILVDTFTDHTGLLVNGLIGFRVFKDQVDERAYWDNVKVTVYNSDGGSRVTLLEDFESESPDFSSGEIVEVDGNRKLYTYSKQYETIVYQDAATSSPRFRKEFNLASKVKSARIYSSALGVYNLYVNGVRVGAQQSDGNMVYDELMPGWTDYRSSIFYLTHDVTPLLREGDNAIGAEVSSGWWLGQVSHGIYGSSNLAFIGKLVVELENGETVTVVSDQSWLSSAGGPIKSGEIYHGEVYDARRLDNWTSANYDTTLWNKCGIDRQTKGSLTAQEGPTVRINPALERKAHTLTIYEGIKDNGTAYGEINTVATHTGENPVTLKKGQTMVVDFGQNASGWAKFKVHGKSGTSLNLRFAEMINDSGDTERGNDGAKGSLYTVALRSAKARGQYILNGDENGEIYSPTTTFYGFRYCDLTATDDVTIDWITAETITTANEEASSLRVDNDAVNQLYSNILWGQRSNFVSVPTDCPQRDERLGWTADTQVFSMAASYNAQVQGFYHKWMCDMRDGQLPTGQYPNVAPYNWVEHGSSAWADAGIILPWNVYTMFGDKAIIEENYESMTRYMDWLATQTEGSYKHIGSDTRYGDWLAFEDTDKRYISVAYYGYMADIMSRMAKVLSTSPDDEYANDSEKYAVLFDEIKSEFKKRYWNLRQNTLTQKSQCASLMALRYNLLHGDEAVDIIKTALRNRIEGNGNKLATGFLGTAILNQTLSQFGMDDLAYSLLLQRDCPSWLYSVDQGATTMWERWNSYTLEGGFSKSIEMNSFNHYAYGAVGEWMYRHMAGIAPDYEQPGFSHIILRPSFDPDRRINDVDATFASNYGDIKSAWKTAEDGTYTYSVTVPANTTATLTLPAPADNMNLYEGTDRANMAEGITDYEEAEGNLTMNLGSGTYRFTYDVKSPSGIDIVKSEGISVYPNPATDTVKVVMNGGVRKIQVYTVGGSLSAESTDSEEINVSQCSPGLYLLTAVDDNGFPHTIRLIKR